jgi:hypothetical protein
MMAMRFVLSVSDVEMALEEGLHHDGTYATFFFISGSWVPRYMQFRIFYN